MKHNHYALLIGLAALACSCSDRTSEQPLPSAGKSVRFEIGTVRSRTVTNTDNTTDFIAGDRIGIYGAKGATGTNVAFIVGADGQLQPEAGGGIFYDPAGGATSDFYAYYPFTSSQSGQSVSFTVGADQSTAELFNASDFMTASTLGVTTGAETPVTLIFEHRLAVVQLEVVTSKADDFKGASLCNIQPTALWNMTSDTMTTQGDASEVKMWGRSDDGLTYWAVIPAQTVAAGTRLISLDFGADTYAFTPTGPVTLNEGMIKKFRIGVGDSGQLVVFSSELEVKPWQTDPDEIDGDGELVEPDPLMPLQDFSAFNPVMIQRNKEEITTPGWYLFHLYDTDVLEVTADGDRDKVMHIRRVLQDGKTGLEWHNGAVYYAAANPEKRKYTLTFTARSSFSENMKGNQLRIGAYMKDAAGVDHFVALSKGDDLVTTVYYQVPSEEYATYTLELDMSKVSKVHNGNAQTEWLEPDADMLKLVTLYISSNAKDVDFWLDDISCKQN